MKSKIINKKDINWDKVIKIDDIIMPQPMIETHRQKLSAIFQNKDKKFLDEQLNKVILHDVLFSKSMDVLINSYEIEFDNDELKLVTDMVSKSYSDMEKSNLEIIAKKTIIRELIFTDLQNNFNITVDDNEMKEVLMNYYRDTNQSIRDFMNNAEKYKIAHSQILSEKTIAFIISKFKFDLSELTKKIEKFISEQSQK